MKPLKNTPKRGRTAKIIVRTRAHSAEAKNDVRAAFIAAGRRLLAQNGPGQVSLRQIAAAAGYSPGTIYQYFRDHRALLLAIREEDMLTAVKAFERIAARESDPERRVIKVFVGVARYWLDNFDHYETLFSGSPSKLVVQGEADVPFGRSPIVARSYQLYERIVCELFATYPVPKIDTKCAVDSLIATVHGLVSFPMYTRSMEWTDTIKMVEFVVRSLLSNWESSCASDEPMTLKALRARRRV